MTDRELLEQIAALLAQHIETSNKNFERVFREFNMIERRFSNIDQRLMLINEDITDLRIKTREKIEQ
jgi:prefoldin subunit 5